MLRGLSAIGATGSGGPPASWEESVDRGLRRLFLLSFAANLVSSVASLGPERSDGAAGLAADVALVLLTAAAAVTIGAGREGPRAARWFTALTVLVLLVQVPVGLRDNWSVNLVTHLLAFALVSLPARRRWWPVLLIGAAYVVPRLVRSDHVGGPAGLSVPVVVTGAVLATIVLILDGLRGFARQADALNAAARAAERAELEADVRSRQERESERIIHDHVVHGLRAVAAGPGVVPAEAARRACAEAVAAIGPAPGATPEPETSLGTRLRAVASTALADVRLDGDLDLPALPPDVVAALAAAATEALRNVDRHADTGTATLTVTALEHGVRVDVTDDGAGFDPDAAAHPRSLGVDGSIRRRMEEVGGWSSIESAPGRGTRVTVGWQDTGATRRTREAVDATVVGARSTFCLAFSPNLLAGVWMAVYTAPELAWPPGGPIAAFAALVFTALAVVPLRRYGMNRLLAVSALAVGVGAVLVNGLSIAPGTTNGYTFALAGPASAVVVLIVFLRPYREGLVASLLLIASVVAMTVRMADGSAAATLTLAPTWLAPVVPLLGGLVLRITIDRLGARMVSTAEQLRRLEQHRVALGVRTRVLAERIGRLHGPVTGLLDGVATGVLDPADPAVRDRAAVLEASVRDDLVLPGDRYETLRRDIRTCREQGWRIRLLAEPDQLADSRDVLTAVLERLAALGTAGAVTISALHDDARVELTAFVSELPAAVVAATADALARLGGRVDAAEGHVRARWRIA